MVIALMGCDNVSWGGIELAVLAPPPRAAIPDTEIDAPDRLPDGPVLYHVRRDSLRATVTPVGEIADDGMVRISIGPDPDAFGARFISAFLREGAELTLFHQGRRAGTLIVDSAAVPGPGACRRLPRAFGHLELAGPAGVATEFLAMARTQAPQGRALPGEVFQPERRMQVMGPILAERALRAREAQLPNWQRALRQLQPFPVADARDMAFTATFLVGDELAVGPAAEQGYSLFVVYTPQAQVGYDTAYVRFTSYATHGKAAPRMVDFLDWNRDGNAELLVEVYGERHSWFEAVGRSDGRWHALLQDRCDPPPAAPIAGDAARADTAALPGVTAPEPGQAAARTQPRPAGAQPRQDVPDIRPTVRLVPAPTRPDTTGG